MCILNEQSLTSQLDGCRCGLATLPRGLGVVPQRVPQFNVYGSPAHDLQPIWVFSPSEAGNFTPVSGRLRLC